MMSQAGYQELSTSNIARIGTGNGIGIGEAFPSISGWRSPIDLCMIVTKQDRHMVNAGHKHARPGN
jgi:hypothetical protein